MAFFIDAKCALIFLAAIVLLSIVIFLIMAYTTPGYKKVQSNLDSVTLITRENYEGERSKRRNTRLTPFWTVLVSFVIRVISEDVPRLSSSLKESV